MHRIPWPRVLGVLAPLAALALALKALAFLLVVRAGSLAELADLLRGVLAFYGGATLLCAAGAGLARGRARRIGRRLLPGAAFGLAALEVVAFNFYCATGTALDARLVWFALRRSGELAALVGSEAALSLCGAALAVILYRNAGPRWRFWLRLAPERSAGWLAGAASLGAVLVGLAWAPSFSRLESSFVRAPAVQLIASGFPDAASLPGTPRPSTTHAARLVAGDAARPNVVLILLESVRARSVTPYAPGLDTTPFLAELARTSLVADRAHAVVPHTSKALVPILCGVLPYLDLSIVEAVQGSLSARCLPRLLGDLGYRSAFLQSATGRFENRGAVVRNLGFDDFLPVEALDASGFEEVGYFGREDDVMLGPALGWVAEQGERPFLLTLLTVVPHHPYALPEAWESQRFVEGAEENDYLNAVAYVDRFVSQLFARFDALGLRGDTVFLVLGDHGEAFGEHGRFQHDMVPWQEVLHVPFLLHAPGRVEARRIARPVDHLDVLPTLFDVLGFGVAGGAFPGASLLDPEADRALHAYCYYELRCAARIEGGWKLVHHFGDRPDQLFDLREDPGEGEDLAARHPERAEASRRALLRWVGDALATQRRRLERGFEP